MHQQPTFSAVLLGLSLLLLASIFANYAIQKISRTHGRDVRIVWYMFSLALVCALIVGVWASQNGAIDSRGFYHGDMGALLKRLLTMILDLPGEILILSGIFAVIVVPQVLSYILSGIFGCASTPWMIEGSFNFLVWSLVKSFAVSSGVFLALAILGFFENWDGVDWFGAGTIVFVGLMLLCYSFGMLLPFREAEQMAEDIRTKTPGLYARLLRIHRHFTRHQPQALFK